MQTKALLQLEDVTKTFESVIALQNISIDLFAGEVLCLLGDNGAGKSTLIKVLSGVHKPSSGAIYFENKKREFSSPREALDLGIATVFQDLAMIPLMSVTRNFFMGQEPIKKHFGFIKAIDFDYANQCAKEEMAQIGIDIRDPEQAVGTLSGGERQCLAIARAVHFGAKVLILDEPTSALGVRQASMVLRYTDQARKNGVGVIFITHNVNHAYAIGNRFFLLNRGQFTGEYKKDQISKNELIDSMAGGKELEDLSKELGQEFSI